jgi:gliding motility-associated-like protein
MRSISNIRSVFMIILVSGSISVQAQKDCTVPVAPRLNSVSVQPETGYAELSWNLSPSTDIAAYIIYNHNSGYWYTIDTLWNPGASSYLYYSAGTKYFSESYVIAAFRMPICTSPLSNTLSTIFCTSEIDTCRKQITISWNRYSGYPIKVLEYGILVSKNGAPFAKMYSADSLSGNFTISDFETDTKYCFAVRAELEGGTTSTSNKSCIETKMQHPPQWINADYATVTDDGKIDLSFSFDQLSEISRFSLEKKVGPTGSFQVVAALNSGTGSVNYTDNNADIHKVNYYRIAAINNCNMPVIYSNIASNIVLLLESEQGIIKLQWNPYRQWNGIAGSTKILTEVGNESTENMDMAAGDTLLNINYSDLMYKVTGSEVCFSVEAKETENPYGAAGVSLSNKVCSAITEIISVPNTFTPDHNLINDTFKPILSFTPTAYKLVITDLRRRVLFETTDPSDEWDGSAGGKSLPEGIYLWFLKVMSPSGKSFSKTGTVNIIFNR